MGKGMAFEVLGEFLNKVVRGALSDVRLHYRDRGSISPWPPSFLRCRADLSPVCGDIQDRPHSSAMLLTPLNAAITNSSFCIVRLLSFPGILKV